MIEERIDDAPGQAVHVGVHGRADGDAELAEEADRLQHVDDHAVVHQRRHVPGHGGDLDLAALDRGEEALAVAVARVAPPVERRAGHLAGPAEAALVRPVGGLVGDVERFVDEAPMQLEDDRLRVGVADVGVGVMDEEDFADHGGSGSRKRSGFSVGEGPSVDTAVSLAGTLPIHHAGISAPAFGSA